MVNIKYCGYSCQRVYTLHHFGGFDDCEFRGRVLCTMVTVLHSTGVGWVTGGGKDGSDTVSPSVCPGSPAVTHPAFM